MASKGKRALAKKEALGAAYGLRAPPEWKRLLSAGDTVELVYCTGSDLRGVVHVRVGGVTAATIDREWLADASAAIGPGGMTAFAANRDIGTGAQGVLRALVGCMLMAPPAELPRGRAKR